MRTHSLHLKKILLLFSIIVFACLVQQVKAQMRQMYVDTDPDNHVQKLSFYSPSSGYVAFTYWIGYTSDSGRTFTRKDITTANVNFNGYPVNLTFGFQILGVKAFDQNNVIAYGSYGLVPSILYSNNGGNTYTLVYHSQYDQFQLSTGITDMVFPQNNSIGYAIDADRILKTTNGGLNWSVTAVYPGSFFGHLEAVDNNTVLALSTDFTTNKVVKTDNAGAFWQPLNLPVLNTGKFTYVTFLDANTGWASMFDYDQHRYFYKTTTGGASWTLQNDIVATPFNCNKMKFTDANTGYALLGLNSIYKTLNSGVLWEPLPRDNSYQWLGWTHLDLQCLTASQLWAGGGHGFIEMSTNGGGTPLPKGYFKIDTTGVNTSSIVNCYNYSNPAHQFKWYVNNVLTGTSYNLAYTHNLSSQEDSIMLLTTANGRTDTAIRYQFFTVPNLPVITSFSPATGSTGTMVTIAGTGLSGVISVRFGGTAAASFTHSGDTLIRATVAGGSTGNVSVTDIHGTFSLASFTYFAAPSSAAPVITAVSPSSGPIGTTVTISGNNFGTGAANNAVFFGAVKGSVISATPNQLVCTVPLGASYEPISVLNKTDALYGQSLKPFSVTFADSTNFTTHSFSEALSTTATTQIPDLLNSKDIDGDGKPDLVTGYWYNNAAILRNTSTPGTISFDNPVSIDIKHANYGIGDMDGDGKPDIVGSAAVQTGANISLNVLRNISTPGTISFAPALNIFQNIGAADIVLTDVDNDGRNDLLSAYTGTGPVSTFHVAIVKNTSSPGNLSFAQPVDYTTAKPLDRIAVGDIDGDGWKDIVAYTSSSASLTTSDLVCFRNTSSTGNISFVNSIGLTVPGYPSEGAGTVSLTDYDYDGKLDIIIVNGNDYAIFRNTSTVGNISFDPVSSGAIAGVGMGGSTSNVSGHIKPDIIAGNWSVNSFSLFENKSMPGTVNTNTAVSITGTADPNFTAAADFDLDGKLDIAVSSWQEKRLSFYQNKIGIAQDLAICEGAGTNVFTDRTGTTYQWQQLVGSSFVNISNNGNFSGVTTNKLTFTSIPYSWNGYKFRCVADNINYSSTYMLKMKRVIPASITINASATTICYGTNINFTSVVDSGNAYTLTYQWYLNGSSAGIFDPVYNAGGLHNNDHVYCVINARDSCSNSHLFTSNTIIVTVNGGVNSVLISTPSTNFCSGTPVTFTASSNYPAAPYEWRINGVVQPGEITNTFTTSALNNGNYVYCIQTLAPGCIVNSNQVTMMLVATCPCITNTWTGAVSNAWEDPGNWSCGAIPGPTSIVVINGGTVVLSSSPTIYSLTMGAGVNFTVSSGFNLHILH